MSSAANKVAEQVEQQSDISALINQVSNEIDDIIVLMNLLILQNFYSLLQALNNCLLFLYG